MTAVHEIFRNYPDVSITQHESGIPYDYDRKCLYLCIANKASKAKPEFCRERFLSRPTRLQKAGKIAALAQLGSAQVDRAGARIPDAIAVAVAGVLPGNGSLAVGGAAERFYVHLHELLGGELEHVAYEIDVGALLGELRKCDTSFGYRGVLSRRLFVQKQPSPKATVAALLGCEDGPFIHHGLGHDPDGGSALKVPCLDRCKSTFVARGGQPAEGVHSGRTG